MTRRIRSPPTGTFFSAHHTRSCISRKYYTRLAKNKKRSLTACTLFTREYHELFFSLAVNDHSISKHASTSLPRKTKHTRVHSARRLSWRFNGPSAREIALCGWWMPPACAKLTFSGKATPTQRCLVYTLEYIYYICLHIIDAMRFCRCRYA